MSLCFAMNRIHVSDIGIQCRDGFVESSPQWIFGERPAVDAVSTTKSTGNVKISPLKFVNVTVAALLVISRHLFDLGKGDVIGSTELQGIVGRSVGASLVKSNWIFI